MLLPDASRLIAWNMIGDRRRERERMHTIGDVARRVGVKRQTIRYYEQIGLLSAPARTVGGQRRYDRRDVDRLRFIRHARAFGFSLDVIRALLKLRTDAASRQCKEAHEIVRDQLRTVEGEIRNLSALRAELRRMIALCGEDAAEECHVIEVLGDHSLCRSEHEKERLPAVR